MSRLAGSSSHYTFVLQDHKGKYHPAIKIELPSSTHIIKSTLAAPQLIGWAYRQTLDSTAGLISEWQDNDGAYVFTEDDTLMGTLTDPDILNEWLKQNKMRPDDVRDQAGERGTAEHRTLERLAEIAANDAEEAAIYAHKQAIKKPASPWERGILDWWIERGPVVLNAESLLLSPKHGFAGTVDLVWMDDEGQTVVTDLKTRKEGAGVYTSDMLQVDSYMIAYEEHKGVRPDRGSVLVVREDGTWVEEDVKVPRGGFLQLKKVYDMIREVERSK